MVRRGINTSTCPPVSCAPAFGDFQSKAGFDHDDRTVPFHLFDQIEHCETCLGVIPRVGTGVRAPNGTESRILVRDTWNTDIVSDLKPEPADSLIYKHRFSGFYETDLDAKLKGLGARYLIFTGCTTSVCVESTVRDAMFRDYSPLLLADCTGEPVGYGLPRSNHEASLLLIETTLSWVSSSKQFIKALESPALST